MLPDPLHPALVHLPVALSIRVPFLAILVTVLIYKNGVPERSGVLIVLLQALLLGSGWLAFEASEHEEDRVEKNVAEDLVEEHEEEGAERLLFLAGLGLLAGRAGIFSVGAGGLAGSLDPWCRSLSWPVRSRSDIRVVNSTNMAQPTPISKAPKSRLPLDRKDDRVAAT